MEKNDIFKTETIYDRMVHEECVRYAPLAHRGRIWTKIVLEISLLLVLLQFGSRSAIHVFVIWSVVFLAAYFLTSRKRMAGDYQKILQSFGGQPMHNRIHLRADGIHLVNPSTGNEMLHSYSEIRRIVETPKLVLLATAEKKWIILQKCWLQGGTPADLSAFLLKHCPNAPKVQGLRFGQWVHRIFVGTMVAGSILGVILLLSNPPAPDSGKSYSQIAEELAPLGIVIQPQTVAEAEDLAAAYNELYPQMENSKAARTTELLIMEGLGEFDPETVEWSPPDCGVLWLDLEVLWVNSMYTDFFAALSVMDEDLNFTNVQEDFSRVDMESGMGTLPVSFDWNGKSYHMDAAYYYDWFDMKVLFEVSRIVDTAGGEQHLYYAFDGGQGFLLYYGTPRQARILSRMTGLHFRHGASLPWQLFS